MNKFDVVDRIMYISNNEELLLYSVSKKLQKLSKSETYEDCLLFPSMQIPSEPWRGGLQAREEDVSRSKGKYAKKPCGCKRQAKWSLEGWTKDRQVRIHFNSFANASKLRWGWICKGTPFSNRKENRQIFKTRGGGTPC